MPFALFGIDNDALNLTVNLLVLFLAVIYLALIAWTYFDARRRMKDPVLVACSVGASLFPFLGTIVYTILRPPEFLDDRHERELEIRAAELRVRQLTEQSCPKCQYPIEKTFLRCPNCRARVKDPCPSCQQPVDPRWSMCPYCETPIRREPPKREAPRREAPRRVPRRARREPPRREAPPREVPTRSAPKREPETRQPATAEHSTPEAEAEPRPARGKRAAQPRSSGKRAKRPAAGAERRKVASSVGRRSSGGSRSKSPSDEDASERRATGDGSGEDRPRPATAS
jgi:hypothetical protein